MPIHPAIRAMLERFVREGRPTFPDGTPDEARRLMSTARSTLGEAPTIGKVIDMAIPARSGPLPVRLFYPREEPVGIVVYLHGGGWVVGSADDFDVLARTIVDRSGVALLIPDYRLAPEHPYPAAIEDCEDAICWAASKSTELFGKALPLVVAGDSAGGNLATVATRRLRDRVSIALQALIYPVTDCDLTTASYRRFAAVRTLTRDDMAWFFSQYAAESQFSDPDISPLRSPDLADLPPAYIQVAGYDVLRDEGEAFARALDTAGVQVTITRREDLTHGYLRLHNHVDSADVAVSELCAAIKAACDISELSGSASR